MSAIIDMEVEQIRAVRSDLQSRRDKAQNTIKVAFDYVPHALCWPNIQAYCYLAFGFAP